MESIQRPGRRFQKFFLLIFWAIPAVHVVIWLTLGPSGEASDSNMVFNLSGLTMVDILGPVSWPARIMGFAGAMISGGLDMAVMWHLYRLFGEFASGEAFTSTSVRLLRRAGWLVILAQASEPVSTALCSIAATLGNPKGMRMISIGLSDVDIFNVVLGLALIFAAGLLDEARRLRESDALTI